MNHMPESHSACIKETGETFEARSDQSLFASMQLAGIEWPVSCRNGTCRTCMGQILVGQVAHDIPWPGLSAEEKATGHCLPCIARPLSHIVITKV